MDDQPISACLQSAGPLRPTFCNIPPWGQALLYVAGLVAVAVFCHGVYRHVRAWRAGQAAAPARHGDHGRARLWYALRDVLGQRLTLARWFPGTFHGGLFYGFVALFLGTVLATIDWEITRHFLDRRLLAGTFYLAYEFVLDTFGFLFTVGLLLAIWRRYVLRPHHAIGAWDAVIWSLVVVDVTGFLVEGLRLAMAPVAWGTYSWVGAGVAGVIRLAPASFVRDTVPALHASMWGVHAVAALAFIAAMPYTNAVHLVVTAVNVTLQSVEPVPTGVSLVPVDIDNAEFFGVGRLSELQWKQRLGVDACVECGRCETACPAFLAGTPLNPKTVVGVLSRLVRAEARGPGRAGGASGGAGDVGGGAGGVAAGPGVAGATPGGSPGGSAGATPPPPETPIIVGDDLAVPATALWACTTCGACVAACPALIEIVDDIVDMRRYLTLTEGALPGTGAATLRNMATAGNPWGYPPEDRLAWAAGLDVPVAEPGEHYDVLYWVGCSAAYDQRNQRIARATARLLQAAGVRFAVMREERCHCESARRMGEEYLYQTAAAENAASLARYSFDRVVAHCPHCFNTLAHEYPFFGASYRVVHHSQLLSELVAAGRLRVLAGAGDAGRIAFHDSCYLGRYNGEYEAPREVVRAAGGEVVELPRRRAGGLCCGGGGGKMWFEDERTVRKIEHLRAEEALAARPDAIGVACPFCLTMLDGAVRDLGAEGVAVLDVAELLARSLPDPPTTGGTS